MNLGTLPKSETMLVESGKLAEFGDFPNWIKNNQDPENQENHDQENHDQENHDQEKDQQNPGSTKSLWSF